MYNFLDSKLSPKVTSPTPATDNYEVTNLVSDDYMTRLRGFLAYSTVKPPVEVIFEVICPINVHYIVLATTLGAQKCTGIEIFAKSSSREFCSIALARFDKPGIVFCNSRVYSASNPPPNLDPGFHLSFFKNYSFRSFTTANTIKICILQTERSVPCLGKVEIWGKPSKICSSTTISTISRLMQELPDSINKTADVASPNKSKALPNDWEIPDDFKDALTFEVMSIPMTLPSGNSVDQSTIEKYNRNEASYGRAASDPFTGQKFTNSRRPVFNAALKSRIDMFLLQHSHRSETFSVKRTLGKSSNANTGTEKKVRTARSNDEETLRSGKAPKPSESSCETATDNSKTTDADQKLNEAIQKAFKSSSFICFTNEEEKLQPDAPGCALCKNSNNLYVIPCDHLYCKNCVINVCNELKCKKCSKSFSKSNVKKIHL